jgi:hypothetical protein
MQLDNLFQLALEITLTVCLPIALTALLRWAAVKVAEVKAAVSNEQLTYVTTLIGQLVMAAEQTGWVDAAKALGAEKKKYVIQLAEVELEKRGIQIDLDIIDALVESAVFEAFSQYKTLDAKV